MKHLLELVENCPFGIYIVDSEFRIAMMNAGSQTGAFRNVRPVIGRDFSEAIRILWPEPIAAEIIANFRHTLETGEPYFSPRFVKPRSDVSITESYEWELHRITLPGQQYGVVCYYYDSTKLRESEEALRKSEANYRTLFESIDQGFCTIEVLFDDRGAPVDYRFLMVNPAFEKQTGIANAVGRTMREIAPLHEEHWFQTYGRIALTGEASRFENVAAQLGRYYEVFAWRIGAPEERKVAILFNDVTNRKMAEQALTRAEKLAAAGRMAASVAHEINNPLEAVMNALFLALGDSTLNETTRDHLRLAEQELIRVAELTRQTLGFYKGNDSVQTVSVEELIGQIVRTFSHRGRGRNLQVNTRIRVDEAVKVAAGHLRQVISNIVANSLDAMPSGGQLQLRAHLRKLPGRENRSLVITIADNGGGIAPEFLERIFEPFFTTKPDFGTGLGLWVSRELVHKNGGSLRVKSRVGRGSVFCVSIPIAESAIPSADVLSSRRAPSFG